MGAGTHLLLLRIELEALIQRAILLLVVQLLCPYRLVILHHLLLDGPKKSRRRINAEEKLRPKNSVQRQQNVDFPQDTLGCKMSKLELASFSIYPHD